jgi:hypothetical protein
MAAIFARQQLKFRHQRLAKARCIGAPSCTDAIPSECAAQTSKRTKQIVVGTKICRFAV